MFLADMLRLAADKRAKKQIQNKHVGKTIVRGHSKTWKDVPAAAKRMYDEQALEQQKKRKLEIADSIKECISRLSVLASQADAAAAFA